MDKRFRISAVVPFVVIAVVIMGTVAAWINQPPRAAGGEAPAPAT